MMIEVCAFPNRFTVAQRVKVFIGSSDDETRLVGGSNLLQNILLLTTKRKKMKTAITLLLIGSTISLTAPAIAATAEAQSTYDAAKNSAAADYKMAITRCDGMAGNLKDICVAEAKAARTDAHDDKQTANYKVAVEKCDALSGAGKNTCIDSAKTKYGQ